MAAVGQRGGGPPPQHLANAQAAAAPLSECSLARRPAAVGARFARRPPTLPSGSAARLSALKNRCPESPLGQGGPPAPTLLQGYSHLKKLLKKRTTNRVAVRKAELFDAVRATVLLRFASQRRCPNPLTN